MANVFDRIENILKNKVQLQTLIKENVDKISEEMVLDAINEAAKKKALLLLALKHEYQLRVQQIMESNVILSELENKMNQIYF